MAKNNNILDINQFKKSYNNALKKTAQKIGREIEEAYESQIMRFYRDYRPIAYERTGATWWGSSGMQNYPSWSQYLGDLSYQAGITVDPANIQAKRGDPYRADTDWVFYRTWHYGIHGINRNNKRYKIKRTKGGKEYEVSWDYRRFPTNTRPAPEAEFVKAFNKIKTHRHLDEVFSSYWAEAMKTL